MDRPISSRECFFVLIRVLVTKVEPRRSRCLRMNTTVGNHPVGDPSAIVAYNAVPFVMLNHFWRVIAKSIRKTACRTPSTQTAVSRLDYRCKKPTGAGKLDLPLQKLPQSGAMTSLLRNLANPRTTSTYPSKSNVHCVAHVKEKVMPLAVKHNESIVSQPWSTKEEALPFLSCPSFVAPMSCDTFIGCPS